MRSSTSANGAAHEADNLWTIARTLRAPRDYADGSERCSNRHARPASVTRPSICSEQLMRTVHRRDGCLDPKFRHVRTVEHQASMCDLQAARLVSGNIFSPCCSRAKRLAATGIERPELKRAPCGGSACPVALPLQQGRQRTSSRHKVRGTVEKTSRAALHGRHACQCTSPGERPHY